MNVFSGSETVSNKLNCSTSNCNSFANSSANGLLSTEKIETVNWFLLK